MIILEDFFSLKAILIDRQGAVNDSGMALSHIILGCQNSSARRFCFYFMTTRYATAIINIIAVIPTNFVHLARNNSMEREIAVQLLSSREGN